MLDWCGGVVVLDEDAAVVAVVRLGGAVAEPDEVPVVAVGRGRGGVRGCGLEGLGAEGDVFELGAEVDVPVCVVLEDEGGRLAVLEDPVGTIVRIDGTGGEKDSGSLLCREVQMASPASNDTVCVVAAVAEISIQSLRRHIFSADSGQDLKVESHQG